MSNRSHTLHNNGANGNHSCYTWNYFVNSQKLLFNPLKAQSNQFVLQIFPQQEKRIWTKHSILSSWKHSKINSSNWTPIVFGKEGKKLFADTFQLFLKVLNEGECEKSNTHSVKIIPSIFFTFEYADYSIEFLCITCLSCELFILFSFFLFFQLGHFTRLHEFKRQTSKFSTYI